MRALLGAPVLYCCFAMWMYNNQQVFENKLIVNRGDVLFADSAHKLTDIWATVTPGLPFAILLGCLLAMALFKSSLRCIERCMQNDFYSKRLKTTYM